MSTISKIRSPSVHSDLEPIEKNTLVLNDVADQKMIVWKGATSLLFQCIEKRPRFLRHRLDRPLDHSIALARSNWRVLDDVPPRCRPTLSNVRHLQRSTARLAPGRSSRPYLRRDTNFAQEARKPFWKCRYLSSSGRTCAHDHFGRSFLGHEDSHCLLRVIFATQERKFHVHLACARFLENLLGAASVSHGLERNVCTNCDRANESFRAGRVPLRTALEDPGPSTPSWNRSRSRPPAPPRCFLRPPARTPHLATTSLLSPFSLTMWSTHHPRLTSACENSSSFEHHGNELASARGTLDGRTIRGNHLPCTSSFRPNVAPSSRVQSDDVKCFIVELHVHHVYTVFLTHFHSLLRRCGPHEPPARCRCQPWQLGRQTPEVSAHRPRRTRAMPRV